MACSLFAHRRASCFLLLALRLRHRPDESRAVLVGDDQLAILFGGLHLALAESVTAREGPSRLPFAELR